MPSYPAPRRKDHLQFCTTEGWTEIRNATGGTVRHHQTFELALPDASILRTHISRPPDSKETYGRQLWSRILREQLQVTPAEFWACVRDKVTPSRGTQALPQDTLPADVLTILINRGVAEEVALRMSRDEAIALMYELLSEPPH